MTGRTNLPVTDEDKNTQYDKPLHIDWIMVIPSLGHFLPAHCATQYRLLERHQWYLGVPGSALLAVELDLNRCC